MLTFLSFLFRLSCLVLFIAIPFCSFGAGLFGLKGVLVGLVVVSFVLLLIAFGSEFGVTRAYRASCDVPIGLSRSFSGVLKEFKNRKIDPRLLIFCDSVPRIISVRSLGGRGRLLISQGLLALMTERELISVLRMEVISISKRGAVTQSFCLILMLWLQRFWPSGWAEILLSKEFQQDNLKGKLTPLTPLGFLLLYPVIRLIFSFGGANAMRKISQSIRNSNT